MRYPLCFFSEIWWWVFYKSDLKTDFTMKEFVKTQHGLRWRNKDIILIVTQINYWKVPLLIRLSLRCVRWKFKKTPPPNFKITKHQRSTVRQFYLFLIFLCSNWISFVPWSLNNYCSELTPVVWRASEPEDPRYTEIGCISWSHGICFLYKLLWNKIHKNCIMHIQKELTLIL